MVCDACGKELPSAVNACEFNFCPRCGIAFDQGLRTLRLPDPVADSQLRTNKPTHQPTPKEDGQVGGTISVGTWVLGAFSALSLLVSVIKGIVPIFLFEAAAWAGLAWYWQSKKTHSEVAKGIVIFLAIGVVIGEIVQIASQADSASQPHKTAAQDPFERHAVSSETSPAPITSAPIPNNAEFQMADEHGFPSTSQTAQPSCSSHMSAGEKARVIGEIPSDKIEGSGGHFLFENTEASSDAAFHFRAFNKSKSFCVTAVEYDVELQRDDGVILKAHGKKPIPGEPLSPGWIYTPQSDVPEDALIFSGKYKHGILTSWKITKVFGFPQAGSDSK